MRIRLRDIVVLFFFLFTSQQLKHLSKLTIVEGRIEPVKTFNTNEKLPIFIDGKQINLYEAVMWSLKAHEGFRKNWYSDGEHEAIGFGFNHLGKKERKQLAYKYMTNGSMSFNSATILLLETWASKTPPEHLTPLQKVAWINHVYNCGSVKWGVHRCCGKRIGKGCGKNIKSHILRREFEWACWTGDVKQIEKLIKTYREKCTKMHREYKQYESKIH